MKKIYSLMIFFMSSLLIGCFGEEDKEPRAFREGDDIIGTWELFETAYSAGDPRIYRDNAQVGQLLVFYANGNFESLDYFECETGQYQLKTDLLEFDFSCENKYPVSFSLSWEGDRLVMIPLNPSCVEYCAKIFRKKT